MVRLPPCGLRTQRTSVRVNQWGNTKQEETQWAQQQVVNQPLRPFE
jgi:hypothetical protein